MKLIKWICLIVGITLFYGFLYKIYLPKINAFGCFDDCDNFMVGYFINRGHLLYRDVFFIHQPLAELVSAVIQQITHPINIYDLVLKHRQTLWIFSYFWIILMLFRFKTPALIFSILYEPVKYYFFGDRYLGESFTAYPITYLVLLLLIPPKSEIDKILDTIFSAIGSFICIFEREPYVPVSLFLYITVLVTHVKSRFRIYSIIIFSILTISLLSYLPLKDYYFNVVTVNQIALLKPEIGDSNFIVHNLLPAAYFPVKLFIAGGDWSLLRFFHIGLVVLAVVMFKLSKSSYLLSIILIIALILANLRSTEAGLMYYGAFHMIVWTAIMSAIIAGFWGRLINQYKILFGVVIIIFSGCILFNPQSFIFEKIDPHTSYMTNYGPYQFTGMVIKSISTNNDTLFVDGADDLIYWEANIPSAYKYGLFTSVMPEFKKYLDTREDMFKTNPPTFYYGSCPESPDKLMSLPQNQLSNYVRLKTDIGPTCLWIRIEKFNQISESQWKLLLNKYQITPVIN